MPENGHKNLPLKVEAISAGGREGVRESVREGQADLLGSDQGLSQKNITWLLSISSESLEDSSILVMSSGDKIFLFLEVMVQGKLLSLFSVK